jgi:hypothetical protein
MDPSVWLGLLNGKHGSNKPEKGNYSWLRKNKGDRRTNQKTMSFPYYPLKKLDTQVSLRRNKLKIQQKWRSTSMAIFHSETRLGLSQ